MIEAKTREAVLAHDEFTCQACGAGTEDLVHGETMRVGVIVRNDPSVQMTALDLKTLCPDCDDGFATVILMPRMNTKELLREFRRMSSADQRAVVGSLLPK